MESISCVVWGLVLQPGIEPEPPALGSWSLRHWTTGKVNTHAFERIELYYYFLYQLSFHYPQISYSEGMFWEEFVTLHMLSRMGGIKTLRSLREA